MRIKFEAVGSTNMCLRAGCPAVQSAHLGSQIVQNGLKPCAAHGILRLCVQSTEGLTPCEAYGMLRLYTQSNLCMRGFQSLARQGAP